MIAVFHAWARCFWRDRAGAALTLILPALVYLLFSAVFGAGARGEVAPVVGVWSDSTAQGREVVDRALHDMSGRPPVVFETPSALEQAVIDGRVDVGVRVGTPAAPGSSLDILSSPATGPAASALRAGLEPIASALAGEAPPPSRIAVRAVGPAGDMQSVYYAGAVSVMFIFFAAMHGALGGLDERRSGLQARMVLATGGLAPVMLGRLAWLGAVGVLQTVVVFAVAWSRLPPAGWAQAAAGLATAAFTGLAAAAVALALVSACRSREQAQPLTTFAALLLAALGGSMAPRFLMPDVFRSAGLLTPHAWAIEAHQRIFWLGRIDMGVVFAWAVLVGVAVAGFVIALAMETRRTA